MHGILLLVTACGDVCVVVEGLVHTRGAGLDGGYPVTGHGIFTIFVMCTSTFASGVGP